MGKKLFGFIVLLVVSLTGCGTLASLDDIDSYVQYASINVTDSIHVSGRLIDNNDSSIVIAVEGAVVEYSHVDIVGYDLYMAPNPELMQHDIVRNTKTTASNTGFFVGLTIIGFVLMLAANGLMYVN